MRKVITYGVFDRFHEGHKRLLERAKALGDYLIVGVATDRYAYGRGKYSIEESAADRIRHVQDFPCVDQVVLQDHDGQIAEDIAKYGVDTFAIGSDWYGRYDYLASECNVVYLERTPGYPVPVTAGGKDAKVRIGLIGCGRIANRFMRELGYIRDIRPYAMYHPSPDTSETARAFLGRYTSVIKARTLEKLFDLTDAVYIASPHETHFAYAKAALLAGKHVLCEKPMTLKKAHAEELFRLAEEKGLVLMEAIKTAYCPGFLDLIALAKSRVVGEIYDVESCFTRLTPKNLREWTDLESGGSLTEFASYTLLPALKLFGTEDLQWRFESTENENGIDVFTKVILRSGSRTASAKNGLGVKSLGKLIISGTEGYIEAEAPWWKTTDFSIHYEDPSVVKTVSNEYAGEGLRYEIGDFLYRIRGHKDRDYKLLPEESIKMAEILEDFLKGRA
ncbi:MAG: Gfo/Idh/MocA family oxidoreductase [Lachnospiraceae bacterium]|nr:Gfo/Idh/MocA family oxidoreductase [Lachnospiraceae bacterium]